MAQLGRPQVAPTRLTSFSGKLAFFSNIPSGEIELPRTYDDLKSAIVTWKKKQIYQKPRSYFSISDYFYNEQGVEDPNAAAKEANKKSSDQLRPRVLVVDRSWLFCQAQNLARGYRLDGQIADICTNNLKLAQAEGRQDLVTVWRLLRSALAPALFKVTPTTTLTAVSWGAPPWITGPLCRPLIKQIFEHYARLGDVQTVAIVRSVPV